MFHEQTRFICSFIERVTSRLRRSHLLAAPNELPSNIAQSHQTPPQALLKPPTRKALLIGICSAHPPSKKRGTKAKKGSHHNTLKGPHKDVHDMRAILIEMYDYAAEDVVVLVDDQDPTHTQPTKANILKAITTLVQGATSGDHFFFHFAGHSGQKKSNDPGEEDGMDEYIVTSDNEEIIDDILHDQLVQPLPAGCHLTAILDSCYSCTLLDLKHYRCNRVYVPFINRGARRTRTLQYFTSRKQALLMAVEPPTQNGSLASNLKHTNAGRPTSIRHKSLSINAVLANSSILSGELCTSPTPLFCDGVNCSRPNSIDDYSPKADVICISSSRDDQKTWEDKNGRSMTQILIEHLMTDPHPVLYDLMSYISLTIYDASYERHTRALQYKKDFRRAQAMATFLNKTDNTQSSVNGGVPEQTDSRPKKKARKNKRALSLEISNFQNPELSSHHPIDMKTRKWSI